MFNELQKLIKYYENELHLADDKISLGKISNSEYDLCHSRYPTLIEKYTEILNNLKNNNKIIALEVLESISLDSNEKSMILNIIKTNQFDIENSKSNIEEIPHTLNVISSLNKYLKFKQVKSNMSWDAIISIATQFYDSRLIYEIGLIDSGFIFKDTNKENIIDIIKNQMSILNKISNRMNLKNITQDHINDLTRDINYLLHDPLRNIFIQKYNDLKFTSTNHHQIIEYRSSTKSFWEIEQYPSEFTTTQIENCIQEQQINDNISINSNYQPTTLNENIILEPEPLKPYNNHQFLNSYHFLYLQNLS